MHIQDSDSNKGDVESLSSSLLNQSRIEISTASLNKIPLHLKDPISRYNIVVHCYNQQINMVDDIVLKTQKKSMPITFMDNMLKTFMQSKSKLIYYNRGKLVIIFIMTCIPIVNLFFFGLICYCIYLLSKRIRIHSLNQSIMLVPQLFNVAKIGNPFQKMIHSNELCDLMGKCYWFFEIQLKEVNGLAFNQQLVSKLQEKADDNGIINFMVYDDSFKDAYQNFGKINRRYWQWMGYCLFLIIVQLVSIIILIKYA